MVTVETRDVGEVKECFRREVGYKWQIEDGIEEHRKRDGRIKL